MIVRFLLAALAAGVIAGLAMTPAQYVKVVPLILQAEALEDGASLNSDRGHDAGHDAGHDEKRTASQEVDQLGEMAAAGEAGQDEAADFDRLGKTVLANLVAGGGFSLMLASFVLLAGVDFPNGRVGFIRGLMLGAAGWFAVQLAPGLGLPPELPGFPYVDLQARQYWWVATVAFSAAGLYLLALRPEWLMRAAGVVLLVAPHAYGAPRPEDISSDVPAFLASEYAVAVLTTTLFFWLVLGGLLGVLLSRVPRGETG